VQVPPSEGDPHERIRHRTIRKVTEDIERIRYNTAIAALMEYVNSITREDLATEEDCRILTLLLSAFAPHLAEEIWSRLGHTASIQHEEWPLYDPDLARSETVTIVVQIAGKVRARLEMDPDASDADIESAALADETVRRHLGGRTPRKVIVVPGRLVNLVV
jgi:leucyl-tRNA synthetase